MMCTRALTWHAITRPPAATTSILELPWGGTLHFAWEDRGCGAEKVTSLAATEAHQCSAYGLLRRQVMSPPQTVQRIGKRHPLWASDKDIEIHQLRQQVAELLLHIQQLQQHSHQLQQQIDRLVAAEAARQFWDVEHEQQERAESVVSSNSVA